MTEKSVKEIALSFCEKFQKNYPEKPLHVMMVELENEIEEFTKQEAVKFLESLRRYIHESHNNLAHDERTSEEFYEIFLNKVRHE